MDYRDRTNMETPTYSFSLNIEELIEIEKIKDPKRVKLACTKLKGHAS
jgi:hypothetical protein